MPDSTMPPVQHAQVNGIDLAYYEAGPRGVGVPVILCHGFPELAFSWRHHLIERTTLTKCPLQARFFCAAHAICASGCVGPQSRIVRSGSMSGCGRHAEAGSSSLAESAAASKSGFDSSRQF